MSEPLFVELIQPDMQALMPRAMVRARGRRERRAPFRNRRRSFCGYPAMRSLPCTCVYALRISRISDSVRWTSMEMRPQSSFANHPSNASLR